MHEISLDDLRFHIVPILKRRHERNIQENRSGCPHQAQQGELEVLHTPRRQIELTGRVWSGTILRGTSILNCLRLWVGRVSTSTAQQRSVRSGFHISDVNWFRTVFLQCSSSTFSSSKAVLPPDSVDPFADI